MGVDVDLGCRIKAEGTDEMDREDWLELRREGIGSSDAGTVGGFNPWSSPLALYHDKVGNVGIDSDGNLHTEVGLRIEGFLANEFEVQHDRFEARESRDMLQHPEIDWMLANLDWLVKSEDGELGILEIKNSNPRMKSFWERDGKPAAPEWMEAQVMHQLAVVPEADFGILWGYFGGTDFQYRHIERDEEYIELLKEVEAKFWRRVDEGSPPPVDGSEATTELLNKIYDNPHERVVRLESQEWANLYHRYQTVKQKQEMLEQEERKLKNKVRAQMGNAEKAIIMVDGEEVSVAWDERSRRFPSKSAIAQEAPELFNRKRDGEGGYDYEWKPEFASESTYRHFQIF